MSCDWGSSACSISSSTSAATIAAAAVPTWRYNRTVCTGLGDRLGALLTVAALAHVARVEVEMEWCGDPSKVYPQMRSVMPKWTGYSYPLDEFLLAFEIPPNIRLLPKYSAADDDDIMPEVSYTGNELLAEDAHDQLYTLAARTTKIGNHPARQEDFVRAYHIVGHQLRYRVSPILRDYLVLHMRGIDANLAGTFRDFKRDWDPALFCTHKLLNKVLKQGLKVMVIALDLQWAREQLQVYSSSLLLTFTEGSAFEDMGLMLSATGIIQHAPRGYSSYSSVPAMAKGIPLISTYKGPYHRLTALSQLAALPTEFYTCSSQKAFLSRVVEKLRRI